MTIPRIKRTFVRFGPYKLYRKPDGIVTLPRGRTKEVNYWTGPGPDGDLIWLLRKKWTRPMGSAPRIRWEFSLSPPGKSSTVEIQLHWSGCGLEQTSPATAAREAWKAISALPAVLRGLPEWGAEPLPKASPALSVASEKCPSPSQGEGIRYNVSHFKDTGKFYSGDEVTVPPTEGLISRQDLWGMLCASGKLPSLTTDRDDSPYYSVVTPVTEWDADRATALGMPCVEFLVLPTAKGP